MEHQMKRDIEEMTTDDSRDTLEYDDQGNLLGSFKAKGTGLTDGYFFMDEVIQFIDYDKNIWPEFQSLSNFGIWEGPERQGHVYMSGFNIPYSVIEGVIPRWYLFNSLYLFNFILVA